jgi:membrane associated rhomboid family serine protease
MKAPPSGKMPGAKWPLKTASPAGTLPAMLDDRSYMRGSSFEPQKSFTIILLIINLAIFLFQELLRFYATDFYGSFLRFFALSTSGLASGYIWQLITFQFLHGGWLHLIFNSIIIYFFGRAIEDTLGRSGFLKLYLSSGVAGGLLQMVFAWMLPAHFGGGVVGASAGGFGLIAAFAAMFPERQITLLLFFLLPVSLRAKTLLWIATGLAIFGIIVPGGNIAHAAHLGGIFAGLVFVLMAVQGHGISWFSLPKRQSRVLVKARFPKRSIWQKPAKPGQTEDLPPAEFISQEVDPILDKISEHGIQSLTEREKKILEAARAKMAKK